MTHRPKVCGLGGHAVGEAPADARSSAGGIARPWMRGLSVAIFGRPEEAVVADHGFRTSTLNAVLE